MKNTKVIKPEKIQKVKMMKEKVQASSMMILTDYKGMTVKQITELRRKLDASKAQYRVYKNTLFNISLGDLPAQKSFQALLKGQVAVLLGSDDPVGATKVLFDFIAANEKPGIIGGWFENQFFGDKELKQISKLPSKEELLSKMVGSMQSPIRGFVCVLSGVMRKLVYALNAVKEVKK